MASCVLPNLLSTKTFFFQCFILITGMYVVYVTSILSTSRSLLSSLSQTVSFAKKKQFAKNSDYICSRITSQPTTTYLGHVFALSVVNALILHLMLAILRKINFKLVIVDFNKGNIYVLHLIRLSYIVAASNLIYLHRIPALGIENRKSRNRNSETLRSNLVPELDSKSAWD